MKFPWSRIEKHKVNYLFPELEEQARKLNVRVRDAIEDRGVIKMALCNNRVVFLFIYEERDQILLPLYLSPDEYDLYLSGMPRDHLAGSILFVLQERMNPPPKGEPCFNVRNQVETHAAIEQLFNDILEFAPDLLEGKGFEDGRPKHFPLPPKMIRKIDRTD